MLIKTRRWTLVLVIALLGLLMVACTPEKPNEGPDPVDQVEIDDKGTPAEIVLRAKDYIAERLPLKTIGDVLLPIYDKNPDVEIVYAPRYSEVKDGVWVYQNPFNDFKEVLDITLSYKGFATEFTYQMEVYGINDFDRFDVAIAELNSLMEEFAGKVIDDNIVLPKMAGKLEVSWVSSHSSLKTGSDKANNQLTFTRQKDETPVKLTAILVSGDVTYSTSYNVKARGYTKAEKIEFLKTEGVLKAVVEKGQTSSNINLPTSDPKFGTKLTWASSDEKVFTKLGKFLNPAEDKSVELTVTVEYKGLTAADNFTENVKIPLTVKALTTDVERARYEFLNKDDNGVPKHFPYGKVENNKLTGLPTTVDSYAGVTIKWSTGDNAEFDKDLVLLKQRFLYYETPIIATFEKEGEEAVTAEILINIGYIPEKDAYGLTSRSNQLAQFTPDAYKAAVGFNNAFDKSNGGSWLGVEQPELGGKGVVFKAEIKDQGLFYYFASRNAIHVINYDKVFGANSEGKVLINSKHSSLMGYTWSSAAKLLYNSLDESVYMTPAMWGDFTFSVNSAYMVFIIHEGEVIYATPTDGPDAPAKDTLIEIPAGAYVWSPAYLDNLNGKMFGTVGQKIEVQQFTVHPTIK